MKWNGEKIGYPSATSASYKRRRRRSHRETRKRPRFPQNNRVATVPRKSTISLLSILFYCCAVFSPLTTTCQARTIRQRQPGSESQRRRGRNGTIRSMPTTTNERYGDPDDRISASFFEWVGRVWKIDTTLVELRDFQYNNYVQAMKDKVDVFYEEETRYYNFFHQIGERRHGVEDWGRNDKRNDKKSEPNRGSEMDQEVGNRDGESGIQRETTNSNGSNGQATGGSNTAETWEENNNDDDDDEDIDDDDDDDKYLSALDYPPVVTRGLAASRDIASGEIILQIPHAALWTVSNRIDDDPVLLQVLGPDARLMNGWDTSSDEIPLLAVALLYNFQLWRHDDEEQGESPHATYLQLLDDTNVHDTIPHLWDSKTLRQSTTVGVRKVAKAIQKDVKELYQRIMVPLIQSHPEIFGDYHDTYSYDNYDGEEDSDSGDDDKRQKEQYREEEWLFSLERFHWAFALVNSRHWHLPIPDVPLVVDGMDLRESDKAENESGDQFDENGAPPASMPTDEWTYVQQELERRRDEEIQSADSEAEDSERKPTGNSFLAPLADLLNFGPPATRGVYNSTTHTFDIVATCDIRRGREITFWYADACQDVFMANYGFTMPMMVPTCQTQQYHNDGSGEKLLSTAQYAQRLERELLLTLDELESMDSQMDRLSQQLKSCDCKVTDGNNHNNHQRQPPATSPLPSEAEGEGPPQQMPTATNRSGRRPPKRATRSSNVRHQARHAIRGDTPSSSIPRQEMQSDGLSRSQKRKRQNMPSLKDL